MTGVIDAGGGMRGIYGAGVLDYCLEHGILFDYGIGISAGAANLASYFAGQNRRNYRFYTDYAFRKEYMSMDNFLHDGNYINLDYVYATMSNSGGEDPLDYDALQRRGATYLIVATNALTGEATFFDGMKMKRDAYDPVMASCCVPGVNKARVVDGVPYFDGALSAPIPVRRALSDGCDKVVVILTRPLGPKHTKRRDMAFAQLVKKDYPVAAAALERSAHGYDDSLSIALEYTLDGKALIIAPDDIGDMRTLKKDRTAIRALYRKGRQDAKQIAAFLGGT